MNNIRIGTVVKRKNIKYADMDIGDVSIVVEKKGNYIRLVKKTSVVTYYYIQHFDVVYDIKFIIK